MVLFEKRKRLKLLARSKQKKLPSIMVHSKTKSLARLLDVHRTLGGMILRGERQLTMAHVRTLAKRFCVSADLFLR